MYLRQWTRMNFFDAFGLYRQLKLIDHAQYNPLYWIQRPPNPNPGYPLRERIMQPEMDKVIQKLFNRYPDLKYVPLSKTDKADPLDYQNVIMNFIDQYQELRKKGYSESQAFDKSEAMYQAVMQRKIDQTNISNNLAINNQARSFMTYFHQEMEYDSRLKTQRLMRDLQLKNIKDHNPFDEETNNLMEKYRKVTLSIIHKNAQTPKTDYSKDIQEFTSRAKNVFECYYQRAATRDKLVGLKDSQIIERIRESPMKIKNRLRRIVKKLDAYNIVLNDDAELMIPDNVPENIKQKLKQPIYTMALMYKDLGFEVQHHKHLDELQIKLNRVREERKALQLQEQIPEGQREEANELIKQALDDADIRVNQTYKLFETDQERRLRLEIKWIYRKIDELEILQSEQDSGDIEKNNEAIKTKIKKYQNKAESLVERLRNLKFQLDSISLAKAGKLLFQEHSDLAKDKKQFQQAAEIGLNRLEQYFRLSYEERRLTQTAQVNDDMIHNLIRVKNLKSDTADLGVPKHFTEQDIVNETDKLLEEKLIEQFKIQHMKKQATLSGDGVQLDRTTTEADLEQEDVELDLPNDLKTLMQRAAAQKIEDQKQKEIEAKREEAALALAKKGGIKGSKKKLLKKK